MLIGAADLRVDLHQDPQIPRYQPKQNALLDHEDAHHRGYNAQHGQ